MWVASATNVDFQKRHAQTLQRAHEQAQRANAQLRAMDERKDRFIATLAHELRNPLAPLRTSLTLLQFESEAQVRQQITSVMQRQVNQLVHLVDDLLDTARIKSGKFRVRTARATVQEMIDSAADALEREVEQRRQRLAIAVAPEAATLTVEVDLVRTTQLLVNLVQNASKFSPAGSLVSLHVSTADGHVQLLVQDQGRGMKQSDLEHVFDPFYQVDGGAGLGLGLTLVRAIAEALGGEVNLLSAGPDQGTSARVRLPVAATAPAPAVAESSVASEDPLPYDLLVCDDNEDAADTLGELLKVLGADVRVTYSGESALEAARARLPRAAILDLGMPRMDGFEVARQLRTLPGGASVKLIALTGWGQDSDRQRTLASGFNAHLVKPVDANDLRRVLRLHLQ
jgi:CheY-like chemotaxis protein/nitrogen-specific signal transduction histidine kinase